MPILNDKQNENNNTYSVYCHTNTINGKRYIGITKQNVHRRWQNGHGYEHTRFEKAIKKYGWNAFKHDVLYTNITKDEACQLEIDLIKKYKTTEREYGYNISSGGQLCDVIAPKYGIEHPNHKRVCMIDKDTGEVLNVFNSQSEAAKALGINRKGITKACVGTIGTYKGYVWEYADKKIVKPVHTGAGNYDHIKQRKAITVKDVDGKIYYFNSINDAAVVFNIKRSNISRYLKRIRKDSAGREWLYADIEQQTK